MSILDWLGSLGSQGSQGSQGSTGSQGSRSTDRGDTETVLRIVRELDKLEPRKARHLAAFAYILSRVANADLDISDAETTRMVDLVQTAGQLPQAQATLVVAIAKNQNRLFGGTENYLVTREFSTIATAAERRELLDCLFAVSAADDRVSAEEEAQIWQIASELGFSRTEYVEVRLAYSDKRTVFRRDRG